MNPLLIETIASTIKKVSDHLKRKTVTVAQLDALENDIHITLHTIATDARPSELNPIQPDMLYTLNSLKKGIAEESDLLVNFYSAVLMFYTKQLMAMSPKNKSFLFRFYKKLKALTPIALDAFNRIPEGKRIEELATIFRQANLAINKFSYEFSMAERAMPEFLEKPPGYVNVNQDSDPLNGRFIAIDSEAVERSLSLDRLVFNTKLHDSTMLASFIRESEELALLYNNFKSCKNEFKMMVALNEVSNKIQTLLRAASQLGVNDRKQVYSILNELANSVSPPQVTLNKNKSTADKENTGGFHQENEDNINELLSTLKVMRDVFSQIDAEKNPTLPKPMKENQTKKVVSSALVNAQLEFIAAFSQSDSDVKVINRISSNPDVLKQKFSASEHDGEMQYGLSGLMYFILKSRSAKFAEWLLNKYDDKANTIQSLMGVVDLGSDESVFSGMTMAMLAIHGKDSGSDAFLEELLKNMTPAKRHEFIVRRSPSSAPDSIKGQNVITVAIRSGRLGLVNMLLKYINPAKTEKERNIYENALNSSSFSNRVKRDILSKLQNAPLESKQEEKAALSVPVRARQALFEMIGEYPGSRAIAEKAKAALSAHLSKMGYVMYPAYSEGDCFFDSVAQGLQNLSISIPGTNSSSHASPYQALRQHCTSSSKTSSSSDTRAWGDSKEDSAALCKALSVQLHLVEVMVVDGKIIISHRLTQKNGESKLITDEREIAAIYHDRRTVHIANYQGALHFVPLISSVPLTATLRKSNSTDAFDAVVELLHARDSLDTSVKLTMILTNPENANLLGMHGDIVKGKITYTGHTLLTYAVMQTKGNLTKVRTLLSNCSPEAMQAKVDNKGDQYHGKTALDIAVNNGNGELVEVLNNAGAKSSYADNSSEMHADIEVLEEKGEGLSHADPVEEPTIRTTASITTSTTTSTTTSKAPTRLNKNRLDALRKKQTELAGPANAVAAEILKSTHPSELNELVKDLICSVRLLEPLVIDTITGVPGTDWVIIPETGHTYDRDSIAQWLQQEGTCPKSRLAMKNFLLVTDHAARQLTAALDYPVDALPEEEQIDQQIDVQLPYTINLSQFRLLVLESIHMPTRSFLRRLALDFRVPQKDIITDKGLRRDITDPKIIGMIYLTCKKLGLDEVFRQKFKLEKITNAPVASSTHKATTTQQSASISLPEYLDELGFDETVDVVSKFATLSHEKQQELLEKLIRYHAQLQRVIRDDSTDEVMKDPVRLQDGNRCERDQVSATELMSSCIFTRSVLDALGYPLASTLKLPTTVPQPAVRELVKKLGLTQQSFLAEINTLLDFTLNLTLFKSDVDVTHPSIIKALYLLCVRERKDNTFRQLTGMPLLPEVSAVNQTKPIAESSVATSTSHALPAHRLFGGKTPSLAPRVAVRVSSNSSASSIASSSSDSDVEEIAKPARAVPSGGMGLARAVPSGGMGLARAVPSGSTAAERATTHLKRKNAPVQQEHDEPHAKRQATTTVVMRPLQRYLTPPVNQQPVAPILPSISPQQPPLNQQPVAPILPSIPPQQLPVNQQPVAPILSSIPPQQPPMAMGGTNNQFNIYNGGTVYYLPAATGMHCGYAAPQWYAAANVMQPYPMVLTPRTPSTPSTPTPINIVAPSTPSAMALDNSLQSTATIHSQFGSVPALTLPQVSAPSVSSVTIDTSAISMANAGESMSNMIGVDTDDMFFSARLASPMWPMDDLPEDDWAMRLLR